MAVLRANRAALNVPLSAMGKWFSELQAVERAVLDVMAELAEQEKAGERAS
jgi:hypothetical protein